ncbi:MAG TPA: LUD domain-containing protein [Methylomirabilota bacterium]|nr:LUD domain-containing protein [Methylomirabilota bacterium]
MNSREIILARVREALRVPAAKPGAHGPSPVVASEPGAGPARWLPAVGHSEEERLRQFSECCAALRAEFQLMNSPEEVHARLAALREAEGWRRVASHRGALTDAACAGLGCPVLWTDAGYDKHELERCDAALTACDALIAQTGSVLVTSRSAGGRALSVLPPHHVVLARREQLLPDLPAAFVWLRQRYAPDFPSFISLITGPSRTGDIERILVLGAHGPRRLTILCW